MMPHWDTMASNKQDVQLILEGLVSVASRGLQNIALQENYQVIQELGHGGYSSVLMVKEKKTDQTVAIKLLHMKKTTESSFLMEFSTSFFLSSHPNIIGIYGTAFKTGDYFAYTQELATNGDLFSLLTSNDGLPEDIVKRCAVQISSALEFIEIFILRSLQMTSSIQQCLWMTRYQSMSGQRWKLDEGKSFSCVLTGKSRWHKFHDQVRRFFIRIRVFNRSMGFTRIRYMEKSGICVFYKHVFVT
ncbi:serine/threonine-protein kinase SBK1-like [Hyla sarda]|uniref:serine/threonine-protein kinase SBK1-like n=1 Tax=Hyla sarda TaxID=327740 RepID=UPI0024C20E7D|nr:serine/threonine-protein kinase SBK1-like [Hyla sarda]